MPGLLNHLVRTRWSGEAEDVATESLTFILNRSAAARSVLGRILGSAGVQVATDDLVFRTQQAFEDVRPDISGVTTDYEPRLLIEGKFWAGFTDAQPVRYIRLLEERSSSGAVLLVVVPAARLTVAWAELQKRLSVAGMAFQSLPTVGAPVDAAVATTSGIHMMITAWEHLVSELEPAVAAEPAVLADVLQLQAMCRGMHHDARAPFDGKQLTDQRVPHLIFQLTSLVQDAVAHAASNGFVSVDRLRPQASWERIGRYARYPVGHGFGFWIGVDFAYWLESGATPVWMTFSPGEFGNAVIAHDWLTHSVSQLENPIKRQPDGEFSIGLEVLAGVEHAVAVEHLLLQLSQVNGRLEAAAVRRGMIGSEPDSGAK